MILKNVTIGADIELFLQDKKTKEIVSAEGFVKGTKHLPFNFDPSNKYFSTSLDNVLAEFTIPPVDKKEDFIKNILKSVEYVNSTLPKRLCTVAFPAYSLHKKYLQTQNAKTFGCDPDFNVWLRDQNKKPEASDPTLRSAGGHIHVGYADSEVLGIEVKESIIKCMDLCVGVPSVIQEPDNKRKELYGKAGAFRFKDYGVEYRTVSNYYLASENLLNWMYDAVMSAVNKVNDGFEFTAKLAKDVQSAINNNDKKLAEKIINKYNLQLA